MTALMILLILGAFITASVVFSLGIIIVTFALNFLTAIRSGTPLKKIIE